MINQESKRIKIIEYPDDIKLVYGYIYVFRNKINRKCYVGQSIQPDIRYQQHIYSANRGSETYFHRALRKYGIDNFEYFIMFGDLLPIETAQHALNELERYFIKVFDSYNNGYNVTTGGEQGESGFTKKLSEETKKKISASLMGHKAANKGKKLSEEARHNMSIASMGKKGTIKGTHRVYREDGTFYMSK